MSGPLSAGNVKFRWFFAARSVSLLGNAMAPVALAFAVLMASNSKSDLGLVLGARSLAEVVLVIFGGVLSDRYPRDKVLLYGHLGAAATQGAAAALLISGNFELVLIVATESLNGALAGLVGPGIYGIVTQVVPEGQGRKANALLGVTRQVATILGPSFGALLVVSVGGGWALAADALCYLVAAMCLARLRLPSVRVGDDLGLLAELKEGFGEFMRHTWIWTVVLSFSVMLFVQSGAWTVLGPVIAEQSFGPQGWGLVLSVEAVGFLAGNVLMYRLHVIRLMRFGQLFLAVTPIPLIPMALGSPLPWLLVASFVSGLGFSVFIVAWSTSMQEHVPAEKLSRVSAFDALGSIVAMPLGQVAAIPFAMALGQSHYLFLCAAVWLAMAVLPLLAPSVRRLEHGRREERARAAV